MILKMTVRLKQQLYRWTRAHTFGRSPRFRWNFPKLPWFVSLQGFVCLLFCFVFDGEKASKVVWSHFYLELAGAAEIKEASYFRTVSQSPFLSVFPSHSLQLFPEALELSPVLIPISLIDLGWTDAFCHSVASESRIYEVTRLCLCFFLACLVSSQSSIKWL